MQKIKVLCFLYIVILFSSILQSQDQNEIINKTTDIAVYADQRNWQELMKCFADKVILDYTAMVGGEPAVVTPEQIANAWKGLLPGFQMTQHQVTNHRITIKGDEAESFAYVTAVHYLPNPSKNDTWTVVGYYNHHLKKTRDGWKVDKMKFTPTLIFGNNDLPKLAQEIVKNREKITESFVAGKNKVVFKSEGSLLRGHLYIPENYKPGTKYPAIVVGGSWTTVKEQMAGLYAEKIAKKGLVALAFDHRFYGESEGNPRNYESPLKKIEDFKNAISFLQTLPMVDKECIGALGVCASSGYLLQVAAEDNRLKSLVIVASWLHEPETVLSIYGGEKSVQQKMNIGAQAKKKFEETGEVQYVPACSDSNPSAAMFGHYDYYLNPMRGGIPEWKNQFALMSWGEWLKFNPIAMAKNVKAPTHIIHSDNCALPQGAKKVFESIQVPKSLYWTGGSHFDFYDQMSYVDEAILQAVFHFQKYLKNKERQYLQEGEPVGIKVIKEYYATYAKLQPDLLRKFFADNIEWHIPGHHPLSGTKKGPEEVLAFFKELSKAKFKAELIFLGGNDEYVVDIHRGWSNTGEDDIDMPWVLMFRIQDGKIQEARNWAWDQHAADTFFWKLYSLKPIPERLKESQ